MATTKTVTASCVACGRQVTTAERRHNPARQTCGAAVCVAVTLWTVDEWRARAHSAARRPPWRRGQRLQMRTHRYCMVGHDPVELGRFVLRVEADGRAMLVDACPKCERVPVQPWWDDPNRPGAGDVYRWLDFEALRRYPDAADASCWSRPTDDGELRRIHDEPAASADVAHNDPPDMRDISTDEHALEMSRISGVDRPRAGDLALLRGELVPVRAVELLDGSHEVLRDDGTVEVLPPSPAVPPAPSTPAVAAVAAVPAGPVLCQLVGTDPKVPGVLLARCGRRSERKAGDRLVDHHLTGWGAQVSCPRCVEASRRLHDELAGAFMAEASALEPAVSAA